MGRSRVEVIHQLARGNFEITDTELADKILLFAIWRNRNQPKLRRLFPTGLVKNTSCRRVYECICGESISESAKWQRTKTTQKFIDKHDKECFPSAWVENYVNGIKRKRKALFKLKGFHPFKVQ